MLTKWIVCQIILLPMSTDSIYMFKICVHYIFCGLCFNWYPKNIIGQHENDGHCVLVTTLSCYKGQQIHTYESHQKLWNGEVLIDVSRFFESTLLTLCTRPHVLAIIPIHFSSNKIINEGVYPCWSIMS